MSLITDGWSCKKKKSGYDITVAVWVDSTSRELQYTPLGLVPYDLESEDANAVFECLQEAIRKVWGGSVWSRVVSLTVDAHSINQKLATLLAPFRVPVIFCYCHKLNRIVASVVTGKNRVKCPQEIQDMVEKVQRLSSYCGGGSQSVQAVGRWRAFGAAVGFVPRLLPRRCDLRWGNTYQMLNAYDEIHHRLVD